MLDRDGELLREIPSRRASRSTSLPADAPVPPALRDAFIASEDRRFEWHPGVDPLAMVRAAASNVKSGRVVSGASTLTQQLARLLVPRRRTLAGKAARGAVGVAAHGAPLAGRRSSATTWTGSRSGTTWSGSRPPRRPTSVDRPARSRWGRPRCSPPSPAPRPGWTRGGIPRGLARAMREVLGRMLRAGRLRRGAGADRARPRTWTSSRPRARSARPIWWWTSPESWTTVGLGRAVEVRTTLDPALQRDVERSVALGARRRPAPRPGGGARRRQRLGRGAGLCRLGGLRRRRAARARTTGSALAASRAARSSPSPTAWRSRAAGRRPRC